MVDHDVAYLKQHNIPDLIDSLTQKLLTAKPANPATFLRDALGGPAAPAAHGDKPKHAEVKQPTSAAGVNSNRFDPSAWITHLNLAGRPIQVVDEAAVRNALRTVQAAFPTALPNPMLKGLLQEILADFDAKSTLMGSSICPDEICHEDGGLPEILKDLFGENFQFGGLGGVPFVGKAGFGAFAHHVPEHGNIFIVVAPHVGVSRDGELGKYHRLGQDHASTACGASIGAFTHLQKGNAIPVTAPGQFNIDHQLHYIMHHVHDHLEQIQKDPHSAMAGLAKSMHTFAHKLMLESINVELLHGGTIILLSGLQVNMPRPLEDFFVPMAFTKLTKRSAPEDLLHFLHVR